MVEREPQHRADGELLAERRRPVRERLRRRVDHRAAARLGEVAAGRERAAEDRRGQRRPPPTRRRTRWRPAPRPAGIRMNVWTASHSVSTPGILSAKNSTTNMNPDAVSTHGCASTARPPGSSIQPRKPSPPTMNSTAYSRMPLAQPSAAASASQLPDVERASGDPPIAVTPCSLAQPRRRGAAARNAATPSRAFRRRAHAGDALDGVGDHRVVDAAAPRPRGSAPWPPPAPAGPRPAARRAARRRARRGRRRDDVVHEADAQRLGGGEALGGQEVAPRLPRADRRDHVGADRSPGSARASPRTARTSRPARRSRCRSRRRGPTPPP